MSPYANHLAVTQGSDLERGKRGKRVSSNVLIRVSRKAVDFWLPALIILGVFYVVCGGLTFAFCRDGQSVAAVEAVFHPLHQFIQWVIPAGVQLFS